jgi:uncharacterized membrane protein
VPEQFSQGQMRKVKMATIFKSHSTLQTRIKLLALFILLAGAAFSFFIYQNAQDIPPGYDLAVSRKYLANMERYGGMINVLLTDLTDWFCGLWQGKDLAFTIAYLTVIVSAGLFFIAKLYSLDPTVVDDHVGTIE